LCSGKGEVRAERAQNILIIIAMHVLHERYIIKDQKVIPLRVQNSNKEGRIK